MIKVNPAWRTHLFESRSLRSLEQTRKSQRVASKTTSNRSCGRVTLHPKIASFSLAKSIQPFYNPKASYLPFLKNSLFR